MEMIEVNKRAKRTVIEVPSLQLDMSDSDFDDEGWPKIATEIFGANPMPENEEDKDSGECVPVMGLVFGRWWGGGILKRTYFAGVC